MNTLRQENEECRGLKASGSAMNIMVWKNKAGEGGWKEGACKDKGGAYFYDGAV